MRETEYRILFGWCLLVSFLIHMLILLTIRMPGTWFVETPVSERETARAIPRGERGLAPSAERDAFARDALSFVPLEGVPVEAPPFSLRGPRLSTRQPALVPGSLSPELLLPPSAAWEDLIDMDRRKLLPPHYFSRFARIRPDTTRYRYTVNDLIHKAFLDAMRERDKKERLVVGTPLGEFGVTPGVLHLGPVKVPVPFAPYSTTEARTVRREYEEIRSQETGISSRDDELEEQRQRVLEWQERRGKAP